MTQTPKDTPPAPADTPATRKAYEPPRILWEQTFIALAQVSEPPCIPGRDPMCTP